VTLSLSERFGWELPTVTWYVGCTAGRQYRELRIGLDCCRSGALWSPEAYRNVYRQKWPLCCTTYASLTGMTDSVSISPATWGRIFLVKFEMKEYSEDSCYFVVKLSLIFGNGSTKTAVKHQALVNSNFTRTNHVHWTTKNKKQVINTNINVQIVQHNGRDTCNIMASLCM